MWLNLLTKFYIRIHKCRWKFFWSTIGNKMLCRKCVFFYETFESNWDGGRGRQQCRLPLCLANLISENFSFFSSLTAAGFELWNSRFTNRSFYHCASAICHTFLKLKKDRFKFLKYPISSPSSFISSICNKIRIE